MLDTILAKRFEKHPGHRKVQMRELAIEDDTTGRELSENLIGLCVSDLAKS
jgi:hypothetical protein